MIDWRKEWNLLWRLWLWYMKAGLIAIPFGIIYGCIVLSLSGHNSLVALIGCLAGGLVAVYQIQGMPPGR